jgi:hypothetical protein
MRPKPTPCPLRERRLAALPAGSCRQRLLPCAYSCSCCLLLLPAPTPAPAACSCCLLPAPAVLAPAPAAAACGGPALTDGGAQHINRALEQKCLECGPGLRIRAPTHRAGQFVTAILISLYGVLISGAILGLRFGGWPCPGCRYGCKKTLYSSVYFDDKVACPSLPLSMIIPIGCVGI